MCKNDTLSIFGQFAEDFDNSVDTISFDDYKEITFFNRRVIINSDTIKNIIKATNFPTTIILDYDLNANYNKCFL